MLIKKKLKDKANELVEEFDLESLKNRDKIKNMIKNNQTISDHAKHLKGK